MNDRTLARSLGWFSIALGSLELVAAPRLRSFFRAGEPTLIRLFGVRENVSGLAILALPDPEPGIWARGAGDALDIVVLASMLKAPGSRKPRVTGALAMVLGITALDVIAVRRLSGRLAASGNGEKRVSIHRSITIGRPAADLYALWQDPATLPRLLDGAASVTVDADGRQHWKVVLSKVHTVEWTASTIAEDASERIAWSTSDGADLDARGEVRFQPAPGDWGTEVKLTLEIAPPGGAAALVKPLGGLVGRLGASQVLHRFKSLAETGEIPTLSGQPAARNDGQDR